MLSNEAYSTLISSIADVVVSRYVAVISFTLCIYDWLLLFADEVELLGKSRRSLGKGLYYFSRIITSIGLATALYHLIPELHSYIPRKSCVAFTFALPLAEVTSLISSYWLLMLRLVALYKSKPIIVYFLYTVLILSWASTMVFLVQAQIFLARVIDYFQPLGICAVTLRPPTLSLVFYGPFVFETMMLGLTVYHAFKKYRSQREITRLPLLRVLYRDGVLFSSIMVGIRLWNVIIWQWQPITRTYLGIYLMWAVSTVLSNRIYLNMVQLAQLNAPNANFYEHPDGRSTHSYASTSECDGLPNLRRGSITLSNLPRQGGCGVMHTLETMETMSGRDGPYRVVGGRRFPCVIGTDLQATDDSKKFSSDKYRIEGSPKNGTNKQ